MGKIGVRKISMIIPYVRDEKYITGLFKYGIDIAYIICEKGDKSAAVSFAEKIKEEYRLEKSIVKSISGKNFVDIAKKIYKVAESNAKKKKLLTQFIISKGEYSPHIAYVKYLLPNTRLIAWCNGITNIPLISPNIEGGFDDRLDALGGIDKISDTPETIEFNNTDIFSEIKEVFDSGKKSIFVDSATVLLGCYYSGIPACYIADAQVYKLPLPKPPLDSMFTEDKLRVIRNIDGIIADPLNKLSKKTGMPPEKIGRILKSLSDEGIITVNGAEDTVELSLPGRLLLS